MPEAKSKAITVKDVININAGISEIISYIKAKREDKDSKIVVPLKLSINLAMLKESVEKVVDAFSNFQGDLMKSYGVPIYVEDPSKLDKDGKAIKSFKGYDIVDEAKAAIFNEQIKKELEKESDIKIKFKITPEELEAIGFVDITVLMKIMPILVVSE